METSPVPLCRPRFLIEDTDRHGNVRRYVRRPGEKKIRIRAEPGTEAFWAAYAAALIGKSIDEPPRERPEPSVLGTFRWLCEQYFASPEYLKNLDVSTRAARRNVLESCCLEPTEPGGTLLVAGCPITRFSSRHARMLRDRKSDAPEAANRRLKTLRVLFRWALAHEDIARRYPMSGNPARDVPALRSRSGGFHTWTIEEVECFERAHPSGSPARLALALLMFTGQRKSDVIALGRQHLIVDETGVRWLHFTQHKNRNRRSVTLDLPVLPELASELPGADSGHLTFLVNEYGRPFTAAGFGNRMRKWCDTAGLRHCSSHGLRKAGACIAAENGATESQLMAIFGWSDPDMAALYTRKARQKRMAADAMHLLVPKRAQTAEQKASKLSHFSSRSEKVGRSD